MKICYLHLRLSDALGLLAPLAMGLAGHEDTLSASRSHDSSSLGAGMEHLRDHGTDLGLHLSDTREDLGVEGVGAGELSVCESGEV